MVKVTERLSVLRPSNDLLELSLQELAEECAHVSHLIAQLPKLPEGNERDTLEGKLHASLSHLRMETTYALKEWDKLTRILPED